MPCDSITTSAVELGKVNADLLTAALNALGFNARQQGLAVFFNGGTYHSNTGELTLSGGNAEKRTAEIKRAYSAQVVTTTAKKFGWQVKQTGQFQYEVTKR